MLSEYKTDFMKSQLRNNVNAEIYIYIIPDDRHVYLDKDHGGFGWALVSASIPYNYICEIPQRDASQILVYNRDIGIYIYIQAT